MISNYIPIDIISIDENSKKLILENDIYQKYEINMLIKSQYIVPNLLNKRKIMIDETYDDYKKFIQNYDKNKDKWIYNIIDKISEQENILFRDDKYIFIPTITWNKSINNLHILGFPIDKNIRCLRDLTKKDINMLKEIKQNGLNIINTKYGLNENELKIYIHYNPSTYHLHVHFVNIAYIAACSSVEYSHLLDNIIFNLEMDNEYYKKINLKIEKKNI